MRPIATRLVPRHRSPHHRRSARVATAIIMLATAGVTAGCIGSPASPVGGPTRGRQFPGHTVVATKGPAVPTSEQGETNAQSESMVASPYGLALVGEVNGLNFTLTLPANSVLTEVPISVYTITGIDNYPLTGPPSLGLMLDPDGTYLAAAAELVITSDTLESVDAETIAAWQFDSDGRDFHLVPFDKVESGIRLKLHHLSGVGFGPATRAQMAAVAPPGSSALDRVRQEAAKDPRVHEPETRDAAAQQWATQFAQAADAGLDAAMADPPALGLDALKTALAVQRDRQLLDVGADASWATTRQKAGGLVAELRRGLTKSCAEGTGDQRRLREQILTLWRIEALLAQDDLTDTSGDLELTRDAPLAACVATIEASTS